MAIENNNGEQLISDEIARNNVQEVLEASNTANTSESSKKGHAAILTGLNTVAEEVLKNSRTAENGNPLGSLDGSVDGTDTDNIDGTDTESSDGTDSDSGGNSQGESDDEDSPPEYVDPLVASIMAGVTGLVSKTDLTIATSDMQIKLSKLSTEVSKAGADWMNNFYQYGTTADTGDSIGSYQIGSTKPHTPGDESEVMFKITNGQVQMSIDGGTTYKEIGPVQADGLNGVKFPDSASIEKVFPGYTTSSLTSDELSGIQTNFYNHSGSLCSGDGTGFTISITNNTDTEYAAAGKGFAGAIANTADSGAMQSMMSQWSYVQQTANSNNQTIQTTAGLPAAMQQNTASSINNSDTSRQSIQSCLDSTASLVTGWSNK